MSDFTATIACDTVLAGGLALIALSVTGLWRNPRLAHALWLLVLAKLIAPPVVGLPLPRFWTSTAPVASDTDMNDDSVVSEPASVEPPTSTELVALERIAPSAEIAIVLFETGTGEIARELEGPGTPERIVFSPDGSILLAETSRYSTGQPGETIPAINRWNVGTGQLVNNPTFEMPVNESPGPTSIDTKLGRLWVVTLTELKSRHLTLFDLEDGRQMQRLELPGIFRDLCQLPDGNHLMAAKGNGELYLLDTAVVD